MIVRINKGVRLINKVMDMKKGLLVAALALPLTAHAGADFVEGDRTFAADAEVGATLTTGNTDTASFKARLAMKHELADWENQYVIEGLYKEDTDEVTAERYLAGVQGDYIINDRSYIFAYTNYEVDKFTGYDFKWVTSGGYGHRFIDSPDTLLKGEIGWLYLSAFK